MRRTLGAAVLAALLMMLPAGPVFAEGPAEFSITSWEWVSNAWLWVTEGFEKGSPFTEPNGGEGDDSGSNSGGEPPADPEQNGSAFTEPNG